MTFPQEGRYSYANALEFVAPLYTDLHEVFLRRLSKIHFQLAFYPLTPP